MRHGKAEPYADEDHARRLTERGRREAHAAGEWLAAGDLLPTYAFVSSAARTQDTWAGVVEGSGSTLQPHLSDAVYAADADSAVDVIRTAPADAEVVLYLGHNPTVASLAVLLDAGDPDPDAFRTVGAGFPTSAIAVLDVGVPWSDLDTGTARLVAGYTGS